MSRKIEPISQPAVSGAPARLLRVVHLFTSFSTLGGVESMLRLHHAEDEKYGIDSQLAITADRPDEASPRVQFLGLESSMRLGQVRRVVKETVGRQRADIVVYHGMGDIHHLADVDSGKRRILILHVENPGWEPMLRKRERWIDGVLCVSKPQFHQLARAFPRFAGDRSRWLPYSIRPPIQLKRDGDEQILVLGVCGRLIVEQKRVDRLPELCRTLDAAGLHYRMEFLGDGPARQWLEEQFPDRTRFVFHGRKSGADYWRTLVNWDCLISVSDYEGTSIAQLEAMSVGVIPVFPRVGSGGDEYVAALSPGLLYPPNDFQHVARELVQLAARKKAGREELRRRAPEIVRPHTGDGYMGTFASFARNIFAMPAIADRFSWRARVLSPFSFSTLAKLGALARRLRG